MVEISQLQTLITVARLGSFSAAASQLNVTQSAISQSVKNLEQKLGVNIFKRAGKKVLLTTEGEKLYKMGAQVISNVNETLISLKEDKNEMKGKVRIGTLTGIGKSWLAPIMLQYSKKHADLSVAISLGFSDDLVKDFESYRLDFLILPEENLPNIGEKILLGEERSCLVFPDSDEFDLNKDITLEKFASLPTILFEEGGDHLYYKWCEKRFNQIPKDINVRYVINSHRNILQAVMNKLGIAVVPKHVLGRSYYRDKVRQLEDGFDVSNGKFYLVYHKNAENLVRIKETIDELSSDKNPFKSEGLT